MASANADPAPVEHSKSSDAPFTATFAHAPWLPVSKGCIKKLAHTRFVNASPKSYRLMPASIESSESDRTSFVEKASHKHLLPVNYFLEVAKLWALSSRSELECRFTVAHTADESRASLSDSLRKEFEGKRRPICHESAASGESRKTLSVTDKPSAEEELLNSVNRFLECCRLKDESVTATSGTLDSPHKVGSETRRYLSQIVSLMNQKFAYKLVSQQQGKVPDAMVSRKRTISDARVNVFTMSSEEEAEEQPEDHKEQLVIIHIPKLHRHDNGVCDVTDENSNKQDVNMEEPSLKRLRKPSESTEDMQVDVTDHKMESPLSNESSTLTEASKEKFSCFYCPLRFAHQRVCARHMLTHLTSGLDQS